MEKLKEHWILVVSGALVLFSIAFYVAARDFSKQGSYAEVKGLSEKIVKADTAIWSMSFDIKSNSIESLYADIEKNDTIIKNFLKEKGFEEAEINIAPVNIYQDTYKDAAFRYNSNNQVSVYTKKVDLAKTASNETLLLVKKGVVLNQNYISFEFSDLNSIIEMGVKQRTVTRLFKLVAMATAHKSMRLESYMMPIPATIIATGKSRQRKFLERVPVCAIACTLTIWPNFSRKKDLINVPQESK
jgi:hypothetical protein